MRGCPLIKDQQIRTNPNTKKIIQCPFCGGKFPDNIADLDLEPEGRWGGIDGPKDKSDAHSNG